MTVSMLKSLGVNQLGVLSAQAAFYHDLCKDQIGRVPVFPRSDLRSSSDFHSPDVFYWDVRGARLVFDRLRAGDLKP